VRRPRGPLTFPTVTRLHRTTNRVVVVVGPLAFLLALFLRATFAVMGSMAVESSVIRWVPLIGLLERVGLTWDVVRIDPERQRMKALGARG